VPLLGQYIPQNSHAHTLIHDQDEWNASIPKSVLRVSNALSSQEVLRAKAIKGQQRTDSTSHYILVIVRSIYCARCRPINVASAAAYSPTHVFGLTHSHSLKSGQCSQLRLFSMNRMQWTSRAFLSSGLSPISHFAFVHGIGMSK